MPDITMCRSETCTVRTTCYRNELSGTKPCEFRQSWFMEAPADDETCVYYWPIASLPAPTAEQLMARIKEGACR